MSEPSKFSQEELAALFDGKGNSLNQRFSSHLEELHAVGCGDVPQEIPHELWEDYMDEWDNPAGDSP